MYRVRLDQFEGPLDLLLFFIRRDELDVYDIPVARITDEYLAYVRLLKELDLDGAAEFIYLAAVLIQIKARMLLPQPETDEEGEPMDPRRELVERLLEYMRYKEVATLLEARWDDRHRHYGRGEASSVRASLDAPEQASSRVSLFELMAALHRVLVQRGEAEIVVRHRPQRYAYTLDGQRRYVLARLAAGPVAFTSLVAGHPKSFVIVTFLAVLDLLRQQAVRLLLGTRAEDFAVEAIPAVAPPKPERVRELSLVGKRGGERVAI